MIQPLDTLQFGHRTFELEKTNLYGILEPHGHMTWYVELFPPGEDDYIMFNALVFDGTYAPQQLSRVPYQGDNQSLDLYEHTVRVDGEDRFLRSVDMRFGDWDADLQCISLEGKGSIEAEHLVPEVAYAFSARLPFECLHIFETSREEAQTFIHTRLPQTHGKVALKFEQVPSGLAAMIKGKF